VWSSCSSLRAREGAAGAVALAALAVGELVAASTAGLDELAFPGRAAVGGGPKNTPASGEDAADSEAPRSSSGACDASGSSPA